MDFSFRFVLAQEFLLLNIHDLKSSYEKKYVKKYILNKHILTLWWLTANNPKQSVNMLQ